ncbi:MAG: type II toxin-antitoxin system HicB family antitoxin [Rhizomicrobium sp.]
MATQFYVAIIERGAEGFGAFFPDFPGCVSAGDTIQETARNAEEALRGHVAAMVRDGDAIPPPTTLDDIPADPEVTEAARVMVPASLPGRALRLNISLDEGLVGEIDRTAATLGMSRSAFLADAARRVLDAA